MGVFTTIFVIAILGLIMYLAYFFIFSERGKTFLSSGIPLTMTADNEVIELMTYDINSEKKIAIVFSNPAKQIGKKFRTGYYFNVEDFSPSLDTVDWKNYHGNIVCTRSLDGQRSDVPVQFRSLHQELKMAKEDALTDRKLKVQAIEQRKKEHHHEDLNDEIFRGARTLEAVNKLTRGNPDPDKKKEEGLINE